VGLLISLASHNGVHRANRDIVANTHSITIVTNRVTQQTGRESTASPSTSVYLSVLVCMCVRLINTHA